MSAAATTTFGIRKFLFLLLFLHTILLDFCGIVDALIYPFGLGMYGLGGLYGLGGMGGMYGLGGLYSGLYSPFGLGGMGMYGLYNPLLWGKKK